MAKKMPISLFVEQLKAALDRKDGYIMGATGQNPKKWATTSWWFTQYSGSQLEAALGWRKTAERVWDCQGLAEGLYKDYTGIDVNTRARNNYASWCGVKGSGMIPEKMRVPGMAVFWGDTASSIHHVAYLFKPVKAGKPEGDWYIIEARGVKYGVVRTKLLQRKPNYWGKMDKYFDYGATGEGEGDTSHVGDQSLRNGDEGNAVKELQTILIQLGYDCGKWGADGDFGDATEMAVREFQTDKGLTVDGIVGKTTAEALEAALSAVDKPVENPANVKIVGGQCWIRSEPNTTTGKKLKVAKENTVHEYAGETERGWLKIKIGDGFGWVSGKYGRLIE